MGHPKHEVISGGITCFGEDILKMSTTERARLGVFVAFQSPSEISGVTVEEFIRTSYLAVKRAQDSNFKASSVFKFRKLLQEKMKILKMDEKFLNRNLNKNFSGGEKKKMEILQMLILEPKFIVLDEIDSGLDIDALKIVSNAVSSLKKQNVAILIITHYKRILEYINPDKVHVIMDGRIIKSGDSKLVQELEEDGYEDLK
jgi:Fe-S cluster assembly ATP-binding protein